MSIVRPKRKKAYINLLSVKRSKENLHGVKQISGFGKLYSRERIKSENRDHLLLRKVFSRRKSAPYLLGLIFHKDNHCESALAVIFTDCRI